MATFSDFDIGGDKKCTNFFYFFLNLIVIHIFFYVDLVRWQRIKATLKKKNQLHQSA